MEHKKALVYKLFAMHTNEKNVATATRYRFQRITPTYILIYADEEPSDKNCTEIKAEDISSLSKQDFQWLQDANMTIIREFTNEHKPAQAKSFANFLRELDKNIKDELNGERNGQSENE